MTEVQKTPNPLAKGWTSFWADPMLGLAVFVLLGVSGVATWRGLTDFVTQRGSDQSVLVVITAMVIGLTLAMYVALREVVRPKAFFAFVFSLILYLLLALWSIGFGYGFWWSLFAGPTATEDSLKQAVAGIEREAGELRANVSAAATLMATAATLSDQKLATEEARGGTCGVASTPGDGPLARARRETQAEIAALAGAVSTEWLTPIDTQLAALDTPVRNVLAADLPPDLRKAQFEAAYADISRTGRNIAAGAEARAAGYASQLRAKATRLSAEPGEPSFYCYDPDLATSLRAAANAMTREFSISPPDFEFSDGATGVARAIERLWAAAASPFTGDKQSLAAVTQGPSLIALIAAAAVDLALFVFAWVQRAREAGGKTWKHSWLRRWLGKLGGLLRKLWPWCRSKSEVTPASKNSAPTTTQLAAARHYAQPIRATPRKQNDTVPESFWETAGIFGEEDYRDDVLELKTLDNLDRVLISKINDLIVRFDRAQDGFDSATESEKTKIIETAKKLLSDLSRLQPPVYPFGTIGNPAGDEKHYRIKDDTCSAEHTPGDIIEIHRAGFRIHDKLIVRKAEVTIAKRPDEDT